MKESRANGQELCFPAAQKSEGWETKYWTDRFGVTQEVNQVFTLHMAVERLGDGERKFRIIWHEAVVAYFNLLAPEFYF